MMQHTTIDFQVGSIPISGNRILAPMDGYSDQPFRLITKRLGSAICYSEFIQAEDILERPHRVVQKTQFLEEERPFFYQLYGHRVNTLLKASLILQEKEPDAIDINLGCPTRSITTRGAGAGLMRTPIKIARLFRKLTRQLNIPVTAKIRLGWNDCQNYALIAQILADQGASLVALHARTTEQGHFAPPNWEAIAETKEAIPIPVIGNGGIQNTTDIQRMMTTTGCDGVMIGRAAVTNPWIFSGLDREQIPARRVLDTMLTHLEASLSFYDTPRGLILFRKFAAAYLAPYNLPDDLRKSLLTKKTPAGFRSQLRDIFQKIVLDD